ncbi:MAG: NrsF family protein [Acidobacteriota bacterium]
MSAMTEPNTALEDLQAQISGDLRPVQPFAVTRWMAAFVVLFCIATVLFLWRSTGWQTNATLLGSFWHWVLSALELTVAFVLLACVLREAVPGRSPSLALLTFGAVGAGVLHVIISMASAAHDPVPVPDGMGWMYGVYCFRYEVALGAPCLLFAVWLSSRGLTSRPRRVGILGGVAAGLTADAIWRLFCPYNEPAHAFGSHSMGIMAVLVIGLICTACWDAWRLRAWRNR